MSDYLEGIVEFIALECEYLQPSDYRSHLDRDRPYRGQPHTYDGERGKTEVRGVTFRDVSDCFIIAAFQAAGVPEEKRGSAYELDLNSIDIIAWAQNLSCNIEKCMGIYPNVPRPTPDHD